MTTDYIECPACGHQHTDDLYGGWDGNDTIWECSECETWFQVERDFSVHYHVGKIIKRRQNEL